MLTPQPLNIKNHKGVSHLKNAKEAKGVGLTKEQIRSKIKAILKIQKEDTRELKSKVIKNKLLRLRVFKEARIVMFYIAFGKEVNTNEMIKAAQKLGKMVTVPVCKANRITLRPCILDYNAKLKKGPYGVREPLSKEFVRLKDLDLVIVPGIAFDKLGNRLGRGKGSYDRFLRRLPRGIPTIGLAFDFQILPSVPAKTHDVSVDQTIFA